MFGLLLAIVAALIGLVAAGSAIALGMRARSPIALDIVRRFSRVINPLQMRTAGKPGAYASVIRHRGRRSGRAYETPVGAVPCDGGFVIALPYGARANWLRNVLASGAATIVHDGRAWAVDRPEIVPMGSVETCFSESDQRSHRWFRVDQCLRVRTEEPAETRPASQPAEELGAHAAGAARG